MKQKRLRWFRHIVTRDEEVEIKKVLELKRWIDLEEEDMRKRGVVQQDAGDRKGWRRMMKGLANLCKQGKLVRIINE